MKKTYIKPTRRVISLGSQSNFMLTMSDAQYDISAETPDSYQSDQDGFVDSNCKGSNPWDNIW